MTATRLLPQMVSLLLGVIAVAGGTAFFALGSAAQPPSWLLGLFMAAVIMGGVQLVTQAVSGGVVDQDAR